MDNAEGIITEIFKNEIQVKRIKKEIQSLAQLKNEDFKITLKTLSPNLQIIVEMPPIHQLNSKKPIIFALYLDSRFPFVFPKVHILSQVTKPTLSDGRDYLENIISGPWSPSILLYEIVKMFPPFLEAIINNRNNKDYLLQLGKYQENSEFDLNIGLENVEYLQCKQIINGKQFPRTILISDSHLLNLEYQNKESILLNYYSIANLQKIERVQKNLLLNWQMNDGSLIVQTLTSANLDQLQNTITSYKLGQNVKKFNQDDVTLQKFETIQINDLLQQMSLNEIELSKNLNKNSLNNLMSSYQQAIEYYSAFSDEDYKQYVTRLQTLLGREDVQTILASSAK
ncbi:unnamed protein product (macronuclear) [Paramecium tetraurelia]|uniref:UBC core domain-containing protein n=1 Tax=Paramecium tetraurelia TaxID=5888 RepID=A0DGG1_PARTE|nr:uncharacterized protein GSPATT00002257001 [Paramecium tetraurelia]CAK82128.1 unnamed protein product [Paramecium tetraurelia]|eukprot:XP_001449525.1 hypothetical protein (macronuclear) [Paramecium tetraurelia strain d4-2]